MSKMILLACAGMLLTGCQSFVAQGYVSPRVTGRVIDATTRAPLAYVSVKRLNNTNDRGSYSAMPQRGGEMLMAQDIIRTGRDGRFTLAPEEIALGVASPLSVTLELQRAHYQTLVTNLPNSLVTAPAGKGPPVINAGDIALHPAKP